MKIFVINTFGQIDFATLFFAASRKGGQCESPFDSKISKVAIFHSSKISNKRRYEIMIVYFLRGRISTKMALFAKEARFFTAECIIP